MSQHAFEQEARLIISVLDKAHAQISAIDNTEMDARKYAILNDLKKHSNALRLEVGEDIPTSELQPKSKAIGGPLKKMFGKDIVRPAVKKGVEETKPAVTPPKIKTAEETALEELRKEVDSLYGRFLETPNDQLIDRESDIAIRGVAKMAGLPVTDKSPKNINSKFIDSIKEAITKKNEIAAAGNVSTEDEESNDGTNN